MAILSLMDRIRVHNYQALVSIQVIDDVDAPSLIKVQ
jgi:hypothetical protein